MLRSTLVVVAAFLCMSLPGCGKAYKMDENVRNAPQAAGTLLSGESFSVADNKGQVTVVQFWATTCPVCQEKMPAVQAWYEANKAKGLKMVSVSIDPDKRELTAWLAQQPRYTQPFAWQGEVNHNLGPITATPTFVVIGKGGVVVKSLRGGISDADLQAITKLL